MIPALILFAIITLIRFTEAQQEDACHHQVFESSDWIRNGGFILYAFVIIMCFWGLSNISEQFLIPALNVLCERFNVPDEIAGSTVMGVGMQSYQFFTTMASLFITRSSVGIGSAIGSGFFNPLCICAGAVFYAKDGQVTLEWRIILRECTFYLASLLVLIWSLKGNLLQAIYQFIGHQQQLGDCLIIHMDECICIIMIYVAYIIVCTYYEPLVKSFCPVRIRHGLEFDEHLDQLLPWNKAGGGGAPGAGLADDSEWLGNSSASVQPRRLVAPTAKPGFGIVSENEAILNGNSSSMGISNGGSSPGPGGEYRLLSGRSQSTSSTVSDTQAGPGLGMQSLKVWTPWGDGNGLESSFTPPSFMGDSPFNREHMNAPAIEPDMDIVVHEFVEEADSFSCYLYKRSRFYSKMRFAENKWQLRWFSLDKNGLHYCINREHPGVGVKFINIYQVDEVAVVDEDKHIFKLVTGGTAQEFQACNEDIFSALMSKIKQRVSQYKQYAQATRTELAAKARTALLIQKKLDKLQEPPTIVSPPRSRASTNGTYGSIGSYVLDMLLLLLHYMLLPFKYVLYYSTVDIRQYKYQAHLLFYTAVSIASSLLWLASLSIVMVICLDTLAASMGVSPSIMGLTFSAVMTSFPNVGASISASRRGMGTTAISSAFGSSVFSIFVGLGLPWLIYIVLNDGAPYRDMKDEGIIFTVGVLILTLCLFLCLCAANAFVLKRWMGVLFVLYYVAYVTYAIVFTTSQV